LEVIEVARGACVETLESLVEGLFGKSDLPDSKDGNQNKTSPRGDMVDI
jgi:hypothetical protein